MDWRQQGEMSRENMRCASLSMCLLPFIFKSAIRTLLIMRKWNWLTLPFSKLGFFGFHHSLVQLEEELPLPSPEPMNSLVSNLMTKPPKTFPPKRSIAKVLPFLTIKYLPSYLQRAGSYTQLGFKECMEFHYWEIWEVGRHGRTAHCACPTLWIWVFVPSHELSAIKINKKNLQ